MIPRTRRTIPAQQLGFTLLELLVVCGMLAILFGIVLIALNPFEQTNRAKDLSVKIAAQDFVSATIQFLLEEKKLPWDLNVDCNTELTTGGTLSDMPHCLSELIESETLSETYRKSDETEEIQVRKCDDSVVLCYNPKSKKEYALTEVHYTKYGVNDPGCPGAKGSGECYWCKPVQGNKSCTEPPSPTPTAAPVQSTATPTPSLPVLVPGYENDESKFLKTYAVYFFEYPGFPPPPGGWNLHLSLNPDFSGDYTQTNKSFGIPSQYGPEGPANASYTAYRKITNKYVGFASTPANTGVYSLSNCGKTLYYRIASYYNDSATDKKVGPTYTATFDCTTKVGVVDPPLSWYSVYNQVSGTQVKYERSWDFDNSGTIDWVDYWLGAFSTKTRYGGWQPPE